jgi:hypothetical protein
MKITKHYCPDSTDEIFQIFPDSRKGIISINRIKGEDYFIEFFDSDGKMIISCNYPSNIHSRTFDLKTYESSEYMLRVSNNEGVGICLYRIIS